MAKVWHVAMPLVQRKFFPMRVRIRRRLRRFGTIVPVAIALPLAQGGGKRYDTQLVNPKGSQR
jgi:hypothetical protein